MTKRVDPTVLRPPRWYRTAVVVATVVFVGGFVQMCLSQGLSLISLGLGGGALVGLAGIVEVFGCRVVLGAEALVVASPWSRKRYARSDIRKVTWAGGCGVSVQLSSGAWVKLPDVGRGSQGTVNTIRAWLERESGRLDRGEGDEGLS
jgi:hypothetical protein